MVLALNNMVDNLWLHEKKGESGPYKGWEVIWPWPHGGILSWDHWLLLVMPPYLMKLVFEPVMCVNFASLISVVPGEVMMQPVSRISNYGLFRKI